MLISECSSGRLSLSRHLWGEASQKAQELSRFPTLRVGPRMAAPDHGGGGWKAGEGRMSNVELRISNGECGTGPENLTSTFDVQCSMFGREAATYQRPSAFAPRPSLRVPRSTALARYNALGDRGGAQ